VLPTWEVDKRQIVDIPSAYLQANRIRRKRQLILVWDVIFHEAMAWDIWVQDCALGAADPLCDEEFIKNGIAEFDSAGLAQFDPVLVFDNVERDEAAPWLERVRKLTYGWAPRYVFREMHCRQRFGHVYLVQVPDARGSLIPEIASMRDDFPAL
jgi:hypothetical protein